jgi:hypothetical protein
MAKTRFLCCPPQKLKKDEQLDIDFWIDGMSYVNAEWTDIDWGDLAYANWSSGDFASSQIWSDTFDQRRKSRYVIWAIDVKVDRELMARFNNNFVQGSEIKPVERASKYDWMASLYYLIAAAEIDGLVSDPHVHGAQAHVERTIADWFAENANQQPSEAMVRTYAAKVIQVMKSYRSKG